MNPGEWPSLPDPKSVPHARVEWVRPPPTTVWSTVEAPEEDAILQEVTAAVEQDMSVEALTELPETERLPEMERLSKGTSKLECCFGCYNKTILFPLRDMEKRIALHSTCTWSQIFRIVVPLWKIEYLTGNGGWVSVIDACKDLHCDIHILDDCQLNPTVLVSSIHNPDSARQTIDAFLWFHKLITSHGLFGEASSSTRQSMTRLLARRHHITDFTVIAEECQTIVLVKEDKRLSSLPDDYIIEIHGKPEDVNRTVELVLVHLSQFPFDNCMASLLYTVPKKLFKSISSNVVVRYVVIPNKHRIHVQAVVDVANIEGGIVATLQQANSNTYLCELIGGSKEVEHALRLVLHVLEDPVFQ